jgi:hypothetical protein
VSFVDDEQTQLPVRETPDAGIRSHLNLDASVAQLRTKIKLLSQFTVPLNTQVAGDNDSNAVLDRVINDVLSDNQTRFNRLAQTNFICEKKPLNRVLEHTSNDFDLVWYKLNGRRQYRPHPSSLPSLFIQKIANCCPFEVKTRCFKAVLLQFDGGIINWLRPADTKPTNAELLDDRPIVGLCSYNNLVDGVVCKGRIFLEDATNTPRAIASAIISPSHRVQFKLVWFVLASFDMFAIARRVEIGNHVAPILGSRVLPNPLGCEHKLQAISLEPIQTARTPSVQNFTSNKKDVQRYQNQTHDAVKNPYRLPTQTPQLCNTQSCTD